MALDSSDHQLAALHAVVRVLTSADTVSEAYERLLPAIGTGIGWEVGAAWMLGEDDRLACVAFWTNRPRPAFEQHSRNIAFAPGVGLPGRAWSSCAACAIDDVVTDGNVPRSVAAANDGLHAAFALPVRVGADVFGVLEFFSVTTGGTSRAMLQTMDTLGEQIGLFVQRTRAREAVRASEARNAAILEASPDCIITIDQRGLIVEVNPAFERVFGRCRDAVLGADLADTLVPARLRDAHRAGLSRCLVSGEEPVLAKRIELTALRADGSEVPIEIAVTRTPGVDLFTAYLRDLTEIQRTEAEVRRAERRLKTVLGCTTGIVMEFDSACRYVNVWTNDESLLVRPREDLLGRTVEDVLGSDVARSFNERIMRVHATGRPESFEYTLGVPGGTRWFLADAFVAPGEDDGSRTVVFHVRDDTERRRERLRIEIRAEIEHLILAARSTDDIVRTVDRLRELVPFRWSHAALPTSNASLRLSESRLPYALLIDDLEGACDIALLRPMIAEGWRSVIAVPLLAEGNSIGALMVGTDQVRAFTSAHLDLVREICGPLAIGIHQSLLRDRLQALSRRLVAAQEAERQHIARELHDELGQALGGMKLLLETATRVPHDRALLRIAETQRLIDSLVETVRRMSRDLRPTILEGGLVPALEACVERLVPHFAVRFEHAIGDRRFPNELETATYRIVQEALTNVIRHANADGVHVQLSADHHTLRIAISDDGGGFDAASTVSGGGLTGMAERATLLGGRLEIHSRLGDGAHVVAEFPLANPR